MIGKNIAHYRVTAKLGAGGMGEVYRATDSRLGREVALKMLPAAVANDADRMARFQREAHVLAALNHPNIAAIYGLEEAAGIRALAMELVEGVTLAERIRQGAPAQDDALSIGKQIAEALEYAHEKGIIHRDLKPANVKVRPDGTVKLLDFGLAKALEDSPAAQDISTSPTLTMAATKAGIILGTAAYMSPEQARGKETDRRTDIWSFGVVLYEMLSGRQLFPGETASDSLALILAREVDWGGLPAATPASIRKLLQRCLTRDVKHRLRDIGEARIAIEDALAHPEAESGPAIGYHPQEPLASRRALPLLLAVAAGIALGALGWKMFFASAPATNQTARFVITLPPDQRLPVLEDTNLTLAVSPDGKQIVYAARQGGVSRLYLRAVDELDAKPIPGTEGARNPFFSPDGQWVGFHAQNKMKKVALAGGSPFELADSDWVGGTWGHNGNIIYTPSYTQGLWQISAQGGTPKKLTEPDRERKVLGHWWVQYLPGERHVLFTAWITPVSKALVMVLNLETGETHTVVEGGSFGRYLPTGHLVFMRDEGLMAVPFDLKKMQAVGTPVRVLEEAFVDQQDALSYLSVSQTGLLAYVPKSSLKLANNLVWVDRKGNEEILNLPQGQYRHPRLSPDGRRIAYTLDDLDRQDVWVYDLARGTRTRIAAGPTSEFNPLWTLDGKRIIHQLEQTQFDIFISEADGTGAPKPLAQSPYDKNNYSLSLDGRLLLIVERFPGTHSDIAVLPLDGGKPQIYLQTPASEEMPAFSPDGRWIAYQSDVSGREEVYVQGYPEPGERVQVSTDGGVAPMWSPNGRELYYRKGDRMMVARVEGKKNFTANRPELLFVGTYDFAYPGPNYDVTREGRFLMAKTPPESAPRTIVVVVNWFEELKRLVPISK